MPLNRSKELSAPDRPSTAEACELRPLQRHGTSQGADADAGQAPAVRIWSGKVVVDVEAKTCEISGLTDDDARAMAADMTARLGVLKRRWEESGDLQAFLGALIFHELQLPEWLFKGLMQNFEQKFKNPDAIRFLAVRHAHDVLGKTMDESYDWASDNIDDPAARGGRDTMMKSYQKIRSQVGEIDRIRPRPRTRSRRGSTK
jgi:hypothetical protein